MADEASGANTGNTVPVRISWKEWQDGRASRRNALAARGLAAPCRRTTARPEAVEALKKSSLPMELALNLSIDTRVAICHSYSRGPTAPPPTENQLTTDH